MLNENQIKKYLKDQNADIKFLPTYDWCFVCGQNHPKGLRIRFFNDADGNVYARFNPNADQTGYDDIVHGGIISSILDELIGWSVSLHRDLMAFTAELSVRFVSPLRLGRNYLAVSKLGQGKGRLWHADGAIMDDEGNIYAKGTGKYFLLSSDQTADVAHRLTYQTGDAETFKQHRIEYPLRVL